MSRRIDIELTSSRDDGTWTWRAAGAKQPKGTLDADLLYPGSQSVIQLGDAVTLRAGAVKEWQGDRSLEAILIHNRYAATHDVSYLEFMWDPATRQTLPNPHVDHNYDRTHLWGLQLQYRQPLGDSSWRVGTLLTANRTRHPTVSISEKFGAGSGPARPVIRMAGIDCTRQPWTRTTFHFAAMQARHNNWASSVWRAERSSVGIL